MNPPRPARLVETMARRDWRMYHLLFHELRRNWLSYPKDVQQQYRDLGWEPPRPAWDENTVPITDNGSGEDFLFMHRQVIARANTILAEAADPAYPRVEGWVTLPPPDDPDFPVPPYWYTPEAAPVVNRYRFGSKLPFSFERRFRYWERLCTDAAWLSRISLGQLGAIIEETLYDGTRARWAAAPGAWRAEPEPGQLDTIPEGFDDPSYDFLRDPYSMHVNPIYWSFFGWVDDRIEDWKIANKVFGNDFWSDPWIGKIPEPPQS